MDNIEEYRDIVKELFNSSGYIIKKIRNNHPKIYKIIDEWCSDIIKDYPIEFKCYWFVNGITEFPKCKFCGKPITKKNIRLITGYNKPITELYCSISCATKDSTTKRKQTLLNRYGVDCPSKSDQIQKKMKKIWLDKYGVDNPMKVSEFKNKLKETMLERYGEITNLKCQETKDKIKKTCLNRYGVDNVMRCDIIKQKVRNTCLEKYGFISHFSSNEYWENQKRKNFLIYGVDYFTQTDQFKEKSKQTCLKKYGEKYWIKNEFNLKKHLDVIHNIQIKKLYQKILSNEIIKIQETEEEFINNYKSDHKWLCLKCGTIYQKPLNSLNQIPYCRSCYPNNGTSIQETDIFNFINEQLMINCIHSDRSVLKEINKELDIYIPEKKLAIEFDGLYWHSDKMLDDHNYHLHKTEECEKQGIQLIHIFEDEWMYKKEIVKSILKNRLGIFQKIIYARNCEIKKVNYLETKEFLQNNHIQGFCNFKISYGLYYKNELISIMCFGNYRISNGKKPIENEYELVRFCNKLGYHIPGAASRLFSHFINDYKPVKIISYCDRRWFCGKLYEALGFQFKKITEPSYWYVKQEKSIFSRYHRFMFRKSQLCKLLKKFDSSLTEYENMCNNGYSRIWDCGNILFEFNSLKGNKSHEH